MYGTDLKPSPYAARSVTKWLEQRLHQARRDNLVSIPAKVVIAAVAMLVVFVFVFFVSGTMLGGRMLDDFFLGSALAAAAYLLIGFVLQVRRFRRSHAVAVLQSGKVRYEDAHALELHSDSDWLDWAVFPAWVLSLAFEALLAAWYLSRADAGECAEVLVAVTVNTHRVPAAELEMQLPKVDMARALRALIELDGIYMDRNRAHAIGLSGDLREELNALVY